MNFEFSFAERTRLMRGPRVERRRVLVGGIAFWGTIVEAGHVRRILGLRRRLLRCAERFKDNLRLSREPS